jgi:putative hemolysin
LNLGAKICSKPAVDSVLNTADFLTILRKEDINQRYLSRQKKVGYL